ncbi:hypothetical protein [Endozoicomonas numazuensis]|uniref:Uncharacterized protein n=1 Tax=Endozoicomonas numazuensis TaxID=1137799 RepID=A0A081NLI1_9GAMM|nr:hypothetical protein [Endozoicomonas numazuensis]KEQ19304.1 hypothetical protein GZ78_04815 [Endozoicomonas numazuensis]
MPPHNHFSDSILLDHGSAADNLELLALSTLMEEVGISHSDSLKSLISASQQWRRRPGQERWEMQDLSLTPDKHEAVMEHLKTLNLVDELLPSSTHYEYTLLLGATVPRMERRLNHLARLWQEGVRFNNIVFLVGQRPLNDGIDKTDCLIANSIGKQAQGQRAEAARPLTETEGAMQLFASMKLPEAMKKLPVAFIDSPRVWKRDHWQRANTRDTLIRWMKESPAPGKTLVISDQPHAHYQLEVVKQELPETFKPEVAAQSADENTQVILYLDALALWLHNLQLRLN